MDNRGQDVCTNVEMFGAKPESFAGESSDSKIGIYGIEVRDADNWCVMA